MKNTKNKVIRVVIWTSPVLLILALITPLIIDIISGKPIYQKRFSCMWQMYTIDAGIKEYHNKHKRYPSELQDIRDYIIRKDEYIPNGDWMVFFRCPASKVKNKDADYAYFVDSSNNIVLYEKENHHYIGWWAFGLKAYNARHVLISNDKNKDIKLYSEDDFKALLDKHQRKPDNENK